MATNEPLGSVLKSITNELSYQSGRFCITG